MSASGAAATLAVLAMVAGSGAGCARGVRVSAGPVITEDG